MQKLLMFSLGVLVVSGAFADNEKVFIPLKSALSSEAYLNAIQSDVKFVFVDSTQAAKLDKKSEISYKRKTNKFGKEDEVACTWVFTSVMKEFQKYALEHKINTFYLYSNNAKIPYMSNDSFECRVGFLMASLELKGFYTPHSP